LLFGIVGYNFVKYDAWQEPKKTNAKRVKIIAVLSFFSLVEYYFSTAANHPNCFQCFRIDAVIHALFFPNRRNARNWAGVIYIVACVGWV
jgi:hypothetical protein